MIVVPPKTLDVMCSAPVEDLPIWGEPSDSMTTVRAGFYADALWENPLTQDMYATVSIPQTNAIYRKLKADSFFTIIKAFTEFTTNGIDGITGDAGLGLLYVWGKDSEGVRTVLSYNLATGAASSVTTVGVGDGGAIQGFAVDTSSHALYLYDDNDGEIKCQPYGGSFAAFSTEFPGGIESMAINPITGDFYVSAEDPVDAHSVIYHKAPEDGAFTEVADLGTGLGLKLFVDTLTNDVFARRSTNIYRQSGGLGDFVALGLSPGITLHEVSSVTGRLYGRFSYNLVYYGQNRFFQRDGYCRHGDTIYLSLVNDNTAEPGTDATKWFGYAPINPRRAFDGQLTSLTEVPNGQLQFTIMCGRLDSIGLFNLTGTRVILNVLYPDGVFYEVTREITQRNMSFLGLEYPGGIAVYHITILPGSSGAACGGVVAGIAQSLGRTGWGVNVELVSYSKVATDDFGRPVLNQRGRAKRVTFPVHAELSEAQGIYEVFNENDAAFCMWQGDQSSEFLLLYGVYKRLDLPLKQLSILQYSFEVLGDVDTPSVSGEFTLETPAATLSPTRALIAEDGRTVFIWFDGQVSIGADGVSDGDFTLHVGEATYPLTYIEGEGGICLVLRTAGIVVGEAYAISYTQPGDGIAWLNTFATYLVTRYFFMQDVPDEYMLWYVFTDGEQTRIGSITWDGVPTITSDGVAAGAGPGFDGSTFATVNQYSTLRATFLMDSATSGTLLDGVYVGFLSFDESGLHIVYGATSADCEASWASGDLVEITIEFDRVNERLRVGYRIIT